MLCFVDRASRKIRVMKTNLMHYLSSVYFVSQPLYVSGIFEAHHQEVYCIYTIRTSCIYTVYLLKMGYNYNNNNNNNNYYYYYYYLLQLGCYPVAVVILHVNKTSNWLLLNLSREGYMRSM